MTNVQRLTFSGKFSVVKCILGFFPVKENMLSPLFSTWQMIQQPEKEEYYNIPAFLAVESFVLM